MLNSYKVLRVFECQRNPLPMSVFLLLSSYVRYVEAQNNTLIWFNFSHEFLAPSRYIDVNEMTVSDEQFRNIFEERRKYYAECEAGKNGDRGYELHPHDCVLANLTLDEAIKNTANFLFWDCGVKNEEIIILDVSW